MRYPILVAVSAIATLACGSTDAPTARVLGVGDALLARGGKAESKSYDPFCITFREFATCLAVDVRVADRPDGHRVVFAVRNLEGTASVPGYQPVSGFAIAGIGLYDGGPYGGLADPLLVRTKGSVGMVGDPYADWSVVFNTNPNLFWVLKTNTGGIRGCSDAPFGPVFITCPALGFDGRVEFSLSTTPMPWSLSQARLRIYFDMTTSNPTYSRVIGSCVEGDYDAGYLSCGLVVP